MDCPHQNYLKFADALVFRSEVRKFRAAFGNRCRVFEGKCALSSAFSLEQNLQWLDLALPNGHPQLAARRSALISLCRDHTVALHRCPVLLNAAGKLFAAALNPGYIAILLQPVVGITMAGMAVWHDLLRQSGAWTQHIWIFEMDTLEDQDAV